MKFRYMTIDEDYIPHGFNDEKLVEDIAEYQAVWDLQTGEVFANWPGVNKDKLIMKELKQ